MSNSNAIKSVVADDSKTYPQWHNIVAGAAAGLGARAITAPLDLLKIRRQLSPPSPSSTASNITKSSIIVNGEWNIFQHLYSIAEKEGGIRSLFRGNVAASYLWMGYSVAQFSLYGYTSEYLHQRYNNNTLSSMNQQDISDMKISGAISFTSGAISGLFATIITYPFDLCRTIFAARGLLIAASNVTWSNHTTELAALTMSQQNQHIERRPPKTVRSFAKQMYKQKGLSGFYAGATPALLQIIPSMGLSFCLHDLLVLRLSDNYGSSSAISGVAGMGAGLISKFVIYPLDTVKKRLQSQAFYGSSQKDVGKSTKYTFLPRNQSLYSNKRRRVIGAVNRALPGGKKTLHQRQGGTVVYKGMVDCFQQIAKREGMAAFYKGLVPSLLKSSVSTGASFWLFTFTKNVLRQIHDS